MIVSVERAAALLDLGAVVAYPTETVYGLGADPRAPRAVEALLALKGREPARGLSLLVADLDTLARLAPDLPPAARALAQELWPGPLTLVVPVDDPELASVATEHGVGFRCSPWPTARALARAAARPLVATSCNKSGAPPCRDADEVAAAFGDELPVVGGEPAGGLAPSTVVAVAGDGALEILREGAIARAEIDATAGVTP